MISLLSCKSESPPLCKDRIKLKSTILKNRKWSWLFEPLDEEIQRGLAVCSLAAAILFAAAAAFSKMHGFAGTLPKCLFLQKTGLWCPACGGTRAFEALCHGKILESLYWHPLILYGTGLLAVVIFKQLCHIIFKDKGFQFCAAHLLTVSVLLAFQFVSKNLVAIPILF